jgi:hypothetical protein
MKDDRVMGRLRAARPAAAAPGERARLFAQIVAEPGDPRVAGAPHERSARWTRPRVLAGGSLALAAVVAALVVALSGSTAQPAFAITRGDDGSVLVHLDYVSGQNLPQVNDKLAAMGIHQRVDIAMAPGAATVSGPVTCTPAPGLSGPAVKVLVGTNGTEVIAPGQSAGNTGEGTFHLASCTTGNG